MTYALPCIVLLAALGAVETLKINAPKRSLIAPKKYLTYNRFNGQFNNQLFQLVSAIQHAHLLGRTLIIPPETRLEQWTGMFYPELNIWNLTDLHSKYSIEFWDQQKHNVLVKGSLKGDGCEVEPRKIEGFLEMARSSHKTFYDACPVINIGGQGGLLMCRNQNRFCGNATEERLAFQIYQHFRLHNALLAKLPQDRFPIGVHSRTHGMDVYSGNGDGKICTDGILKTLQSHAGRVSSESLQTASAQCELWKRGALDRQIGLPLLTPDSLESPPLNFLLVHDHAHEWDKTYWRNMHEFQADTAPDTNGLTIAKERNNATTQFDFTAVHIERLAKSLLDLYALVEPAYFVGNLYSTFSLSVCMLRGEERKAASNVCGILMHPDQEKSDMQPVAGPWELDLKVRDLFASWNERTDSDHHFVVPKSHQSFRNLWNFVDQRGPIKQPSSFEVLMQEEHSHLKEKKPLFAIVDLYLLQNNTKGTSFVVLGEGILPGLKFESPSVFKTDLQCVFESGAKIDADVQLMRQKDGSLIYKRNDTHIFSDNDDVFRTHYVICSSGKQRDRLLKLERGIQTFWNAPKERVDALFSDLPVHREGLSVCLAPIYGQDVRWFIEWMEYHKQLGVAHVHIPVHSSASESPMLWDAARRYENAGFATLVDWSDSTSGFIIKQSYERSKWSAWNGCYLTNRGVTDWLAFIDLDEILSRPKIGMKRGLEMLAGIAKDKGKLGFAMNSVTVSSVLVRNLNSFQKSHKFLLEEFDEVEANCLAPYNCGEFHQGRQKFILRTAERDAPLVMTWTHGLSRDYDYSSKLMEQTPEDLFHVRHYQAWWYKNGTSLKPEVEKRRSATIETKLTNAMLASMLRDGYLMHLYMRAAADLSQVHPWGRSIASYLKGD